jgi:hypothetical protein
MISIYESGSTDDTPKFLAILEVLLLAVGGWAVSLTSRAELEVH